MNDYITLACIDIKKKNRSYDTEVAYTLEVCIYTHIHTHTHTHTHTHKLVAAPVYISIYTVAAPVYIDIYTYRYIYYVAMWRRYRLITASAVISVVTNAFRV